MTPENSEIRHVNEADVRTELGSTHFRDVNLRVIDGVLYVEHGARLLGMFSPPWAVDAI